MFCLLLALSHSATAEPAKLLQVDVFPPETEVRLFLSGSPPEGDLVANGATVPIPSENLDFQARLTAPGFEGAERRLKLLGVNQVGENRWVFTAKLRPSTPLAFLRYQWRFSRGFLVGCLTLVLAGFGAAAWGIRRRFAVATDQRDQAHEKVVELEKRVKQNSKDLVGQVLDPYLLKEKIGTGSYSVVYKAENQESGEVVALKILKEDVLNEEIRARLKREIEIGTLLTHPNLVKLYGFGYLEDLPYTISEFVQGRPLDQVLTTEDRLSFPQVGKIMLQVVSGLAYAHENSVVHRDLKPANILITDDGKAKVLDFGLATLMELENRITATGEAMGTPLYMSPEQTKAEFCQASDYYSFGLILFEMLAGEPPFGGSKAVEIMAAHAFKKPPRVHWQNPDVPQEVSDLIGELLLKDPDQRLTDPERIRSVLENYLLSGS